MKKKLACASCGGTKKMKKGGSTLSGSAIKKAPVQLYGIPQENMGTSGQYGKMMKGGATSSRAVQTSCKGGLVRDANGKCVMERKMAKGGPIKKLQEKRIDSLYQKKKAAALAGNMTKKERLDDKITRLRGNSLEKDDFTMQTGGAKKPSKKYVDSKIKVNPKSPERPMPKPMMAKKGGSVKKRK
jgi:hypothetical protein